MCYCEWDPERNRLSYALSIALRGTWTPARVPPRIKSLLTLLSECRCTVDCGGCPEPMYEREPRSLVQPPGLDG